MSYGHNCIGDYSICLCDQKSFINVHSILSGYSGMGVF